MRRSALPSRLLAVLVASVAGIVASFAGCSSPDPQLCGQIPAGGCPVGRGGTCADATCAALFDCVAGAWTITESCPRVDAGAREGGTGGSSGTGGGGPCTPVQFKHTGEAHNCMPDLENPDCPAAAAEGCAEAACSTGCTDFFLCVAAGWTAVAYCDDTGRLVIKQ